MRKLADERLARAWDRLQAKRASATTSPRVLGYDCHTKKLSGLFMAQLQQCEYECVTAPELSATMGAQLGIACRGDPIATATGDLTTRSHQALAQ